MRIISGSYRGRRLFSVPGRVIRPTTSPIREALFSILGGRVVAHPFFDLCAGTGAVGLEALSRGASRVVFVERDRKAVAVIERNLERLDVDRSAGLVEVRSADVASWLRRAGPLEEAVPAIVFIDPPYDMVHQAMRWMAALAAPGRLVVGSRIVLEHRAGERPPVARANGRLEDEWSRGYGETELSSFLVRESVLL